MPSMGRGSAHVLQIILLESSSANIVHNLIYYTFNCSQLCDEIDEHEKNSSDMIKEEKKRMPGTSENKKIFPMPIGYLQTSFLANQLFCYVY